MEFRMTRWSPDNFATAIRAIAAAVEPDRPALVHGDQVITWRDFDRQTDALAAYRDTRLVSSTSTTETYVALKLEVASWRWSGVPFYLRTGKALAARDTEIVIQFRDAPIMLFRDAEMGALPPNRLILQIQPNEGISMDFAAKRPGPIFETAEVRMNFHYSDRFEVGQRTGNVYSTRADIQRAPAADRHRAAGYVHLFNIEYATPDV